MVWKIGTCHSMATFPLFSNTVFWEIKVKQFQIGPGKFITYTVVQILYLDLKLSVTNDCQDEA